jgi:hypothetical protein
VQPGLKCCVIEMYVLRCWGSLIISMAVSLQAVLVLSVLSGKMLKPTWSCKRKVEFVCLPSVLQHQFLVVGVGLTGLSHSRGFLKSSVRSLHTSFVYWRSSLWHCWGFSNLLCLFLVTCSSSYILCVSFL